MELPVPSVPRITLWACLISLSLSHYSTTAVDLNPICHFSASQIQRQFSIELPPIRRNSQKINSACDARTIIMHTITFVAMLHQRCWQRKLLLIIPPGSTRTAMRQDGHYCSCTWVHTMSMVLRRTKFTRDAPKTWHEIHFSALIPVSRNLCTPFTLHIGLCKRI